MKIFLTGASGFVGSHLLSRLVDSGHRVAVLLRDPAAAWRLEGRLDRVELIRGELDTPGGWADAFRRFGPEAVAHLAWDGVGNRRRNDTAQLANIGTTVGLVELARDSGVRHWVGLGSQA